MPSIGQGVIRFATPADASRIAEIHVAGWRAAYRGIVSEPFLASLSADQRAEGWRRGIEANPRLVLACEDEGRMVGWVAVGPARDSDAKTAGEVYALYVAPERWGRRIGRVLMERGEEELRGRGLAQIVLWLLEQNERARRFYESLHYAPDGRSMEITFGETKLMEVRYAKKEAVQAAGR